MKTQKILSLLIVLILAASVAADETRAADPAPKMDIGYGVRAGTNFSSYRGTGDLFGWQVGGAIDYPFKKIKMGRKWALVNIASEPMFVAKGGEYSYGIWPISIDYTVRTYYVEVPIYGSFKFFVSQNFNVRADLGPYVGIGLFGDNEIINRNENPFSGSGSLSRFDIGVHYGVAIEFMQNFYFAIKRSDGWTGDNVDAFYQTLGYNF